MIDLVLHVLRVLVVQGLSQAGLGFAAVVVLVLGRLLLSGSRSGR